jgi:serine/threonine-protein kinase RsbT
MATEWRLAIQSDRDIVTARQQGRSLAEQVGFASGDQTLIATAISELARNIASYARTGEIVLRVERWRGQRGVAVIAQDQGPGIPDVTEALRDGYSTSHGMGLGLPGTRRLMDEFEIVSEVGKGTTVTTKKWRH